MNRAKPNERITKSLRNGVRVLLSLSESLVFSISVFWTPVSTFAGIGPVFMLVATVAIIADTARLAMISCKNADEGARREVGGISSSMYRVLNFCPRWSLGGETKHTVFKDC